RRAHRARAARAAATVAPALLAGAIGVAAHRAHTLVAGRARAVDGARAAVLARHWVARVVAAAGVRHAPARLAEKARPARAARAATAVVAARFARAARHAARPRDAPPRSASAVAWARLA